MAMACPKVYLQMPPINSKIVLVENGKTDTNRGQGRSRRPSPRMMRHPHVRNGLRNVIRTSCESAGGGERRTIWIIHVRRRARGSGICNGADG